MDIVYGGLYESDFEKSTSHRPCLLRAFGMDLGRRLNKQLANLASNRRVMTCAFKVRSGACRPTVCLRRVIYVRTATTAMRISYRTALRRLQS